jgi:hypothetical protein
VNPRGPEAHARLPHDAMVQTAPGRGLVAPPVSAGAPDSPHGARGCGGKSPSGNTPRRKQWATQRASDWASVYVRPLYGCSGGWVGPMHPVAGLHQSSAEPGPVVGGLHHDALEVCRVPGAWLQQGGPMLRSASVREPLGLRIAYHDHTVVCMPSKPAV